MKYAFDFQTNLLSFMITNPKGLSYLRHSPDNIFDDPSHLAIFRFARMYIEKYKKRPSLINFKAFLDEKSGFSDQNNELKKPLFNIIDKLYQPLPDDVSIIENSIIDFIQFTLTDKFLEEYSVKMHTNENDVEMYAKMRSEMSHILNVRKQLEPDPYDNLFLSKTTLSDLQNSMKTVFPTCFIKINEAQSAGGFTPPEIVVFVAGPKAGKTTLLINLSNGFVRQGFKVLYIDTENGVDRILKLSMQQFLQCTQYELQTGWKLKRNVETQSIDFKDNEYNLRHNRYDYKDFYNLKSRYYYDVEKLIELNLPKILSIGGDLKVEYISSNGTIDDVYAICDRLRELHNYVPDIIVCDYFDNMKSNRTGRTDKRFMIQDVYMSWKDLAAKLNCLVLTVSQTNRQAYEKEELEATDVGEDFSKVANADSIWAFSRSREDRQNSIGVISPIANRNGSDNRDLYSFPIRIDPTRCLITDMYREELERKMESDLDLTTLANDGDLSNTIDNFK